MDLWKQPLNYSHQPVWTHATLYSQGQKGKFHKDNCPSCCFCMCFIAAWCSHTFRNAQIPAKTPQSSARVWQIQSETLPAEPPPQVWDPEAASWLSNKTARFYHNHWSCLWKLVPTPVAEWAGAERPERSLLSLKCVTGSEVCPLSRWRRFTFLSDRRWQQRRPPRRDDHKSKPSSLEARSRDGGLVLLCNLSHVPGARGWGWREKEEKKEEKKNGHIEAFTP